MVIAGVLCGGLITGGILFLGAGFIGAIDEGVRGWIGIGAMGVVAVMERSHVGFPSLGRFIPQEVVVGRHGLGIVRFSFELGLGFLTVVPHAGPYALAVVVLLGNTGALDVLFIGLGWSIGRSAPVILRFLRPAVRGSRVELLDAGLIEVANFERVLRRLGNVATVLVVAGGAGVLVDMLAI